MRVGQLWREKWTALSGESGPLRAVYLSRHKWPTLTTGFVSLHRAPPDLSEIAAVSCKVPLLNYLLKHLRNHLLNHLLNHFLHNRPMISRPGGSPGAKR